METQKIYRGRLIDHLHLVVEDLEKSKKFYRAVAASLNIEVGGEAPDYIWIDELFISSKESKAAVGKTTGRVHFALQARDKSEVESFHKACIAAGGKDNGAPGDRPYHPGYYAAFVLDPDGNNVEAVYHGPGKRSTAAIEITF